MTIQHFHGVPSRLARIIRLTRASPIPFSIFTSLMSALQAGNKASSRLYGAHAYEEIKNWFSIYTKCFDSSIATWDENSQLNTSGGLTCYVCVLDGVFDPIWCAKRPRTSRTTNLHFTSSCETHGLQFLVSEFWRRQ